MNRILFEAPEQGPELLTFANFKVGEDDVAAIGGGVLPEMATRFDYDLPEQPSSADLKGLIGAVGPAKELQKNIEATQKGMHERNSGDRRPAVDVARDWVERSGLLVPVDRDVFGDTITSPATTEADADDELPTRSFGLAVVTGGVLRWMERRGEQLNVCASEAGIGKICLVGGTRVLKGSEGPGVLPKTTEGDYLENFIAPRFSKLGYDIDVVKPDSSKGSDIAGAVADKVAAEQIDPSDVLVVATAGNWPQNGGQITRAMIERGMIDPKAGERRSPHVISDAFPLGTGTESAATHQNPYSALGQLVRAAYELQLLKEA